MRKIRFRQAILINGEFAYFRYWGFVEEGWKSPEITPKNFDKVESQCQQYVGLNDAKGQPIYEGDILLLEDTYTDRILDDGTGPIEQCHHLAPVVLENIGGFGLAVKDGADTFNNGFWSFERIVNEMGQARFKLIGNIYENPELVKP